MNNPIVSQPSNDKYRNGYDQIFKPKRVFQETEKPVEADKYPGEEVEREETGRS